ncbi:MAG: hypothetical protein HY447_03670, partial [Candidatus Omnitrophica bacterium]|nr:hypothetical protein [Candidatus Omnitrophota bacterium]
YYGVVKHPVLSSQELENIQEECYETDFKVLGPSVVRAVENWLLGYQRLIQEKSEILRKRAETYKKDILNALPIFLTARLLGPSKQARDYANRLYEEIVKMIKSSTVSVTLKSWVALAMACWTGLCLKFDWFQHPRTSRLIYRLPG